HILHPSSPSQSFNPHPSSPTSFILALTVLPILTIPSHPQPVILTHSLPSPACNPHPFPPIPSL
ncbi:hypothetical protein Pcinc_029522, partial [Petrolisthes cinctipes]